MRPLQSKLNGVFKTPISWVVVSRRTLDILKYAFTPTRLLLLVYQSLNLAIHINTMVFSGDHQNFTKLTATVLLGQPIHYPEDYRANDYRPDRHATALPGATHYKAGEVHSYNSHDKHLY